MSTTASRRPARRARLWASSRTPSPVASPISAPAEPDVHVADSRCRSTRGAARRRSGDGVHVDAADDRDLLARADRHATSTGSSPDGTDPTCEPPRPWRTFTHKDARDGGFRLSAVSDQDLVKVVQRRSRRPTRTTDDERRGRLRAKGSSSGSRMTSAPRPCMLSANPAYPRSTWWAPLTVVTPSATRPATTSAAPARMSLASTGAPDSSVDAVDHDVVAVDARRRRRAGPAPGPCGSGPRRGSR